MFVCIALVVSACGGGGDDPTSAPDLDKVPTATLPAKLPDAVIVGGGAILPGGSATYTIRSGDTLAGIASRLGITLEDLRAANPGVDPATLRTGQVVNLPQLPDGVPTVAPPTSNTQPPGTREPATETPEPVPTDTPEPVATNTPASLGQTYIVKSGDIPVTIAEQFGITVEALLAANPTIDPRGLQVGQVLVIPPAPAAEPTPAA